MVARHRVSIPVPVQRVPFVRNWLTPALESWTRAMYPPRRRGFIVFGWLIWLWLAFEFIRVTIWLGWALVLMALWLGITVPWDMATYYWRRK